MTSPRPHPAASPTRILATGSSTPATLPMGDATRATAFAPGQRIGDFEVLSLLGEGGMGQVWQARDCTLGRIVALKTMRQGDASTWARFAREAQLASTLDHPHIAKLYAFSYDPPFMAFQLIAGAALAGCDERAIRALHDAAAAVHHAHRHGVLHRDLKPDNIIVDATGSAFVLDFGLARPIGDEDHLTLSGEVVGTPAYMSPEQAAGDAHLTPRSDTYGLGAVLYAMLSGHAPYSGSGAWDVIRLVQVSDPPRPGGDRDLETICLKAMAREPERRYHSAQAFADDLGRWLRREPVLARRAGLGYRLARSIQRRTAVWVLSALLVVAAAISAATAVVLLAEGNEHLRESSSAAATAAGLEHAKAVALAADANDAALESEVSARERALALHDGRLALALAPADLAAERGAVERELATIDAERARWPDEAILDCLAGENLLLLNREREALGRFDASLGRPPARLSRSFGVEARAHLDRAKARLLSRFADLMCRLFMFQDTQDYRDYGPDRDRIIADLAAAGHDDGYEQQVLALWCRYLGAANTANPVPVYIATRDDALKLVERGGRSDELVNVLAGVLDPPPRADAVACFAAAIARSHNFAQAWLLRAQERCFANQGDQARPDVDEALRRKPDYAIAHFLRSELPESRSGADLRAALAHADAAVALEPLEPACLWSRARLHWALHDWGAAFQDELASLDRCRATPSYRAVGTLWEQLARMEREAGRTQDAIRCWERAVAKGMLADALPCAQAAAGSEPLARTADRLAPIVNHTEAGWLLAACQARVWLGGQRLALGDRDGARAQARWVLERVPGAPSAAVLEARVAALSATTREAVLAAFAPAHAAVANSRYDATVIKRLEADALAAEAEALARVGDAAGAGADIEGALARVPDHDAAWAARLRAARDAHDDAALARARAARAAQVLEQARAQRADCEFAAAETTLQDFTALAGPDEGIASALAGIRADRAAAASAAGAISQQLAQAGSF